MADRLTREHRSWNMSRIRGRDTKPELQLRSMLHRAGFRFRLHYPQLSGKPDIVLPKCRTAIFVHGCYWHRHRRCPKATVPSSNTEFWRKKFDATVARDQKNVSAIKAAGWHVIVVWECELESDPAGVLASVAEQLRMAR